MRWSDDRVRYLLADEVGLGKTIEAGLVMRELKLRGMVRRTLVVAPKGLVTQWISEMRTHLDEEFRLFIPSDFAGFRRITREDNVWQTYDQVVCSMDSVKPLDGRRSWSRDRVTEHNRDRFEDLTAAGWDLIIVDEAHRLGGSTEQIARHKLGRGLAQAAPYLLLLSATPHQGKTDGFHRLVSLVDEDAFPDASSISRERVQPFVIRTEKRHAIDAEGQPLGAPRPGEAWRRANHLLLPRFQDAAFRSHRIRKERTGRPVAGRPQRVPAAHEVVGQDLFQRQQMSKAAASICKGLEEAVRYAKGTAPKHDYRVHISAHIDVKAIRARLGMTQKAFAARFGFSVNTLRHWEQGAREPEGPTRAYLLVIDRAPDLVQDALRSA